MQTDSDVKPTEANRQLSDELITLIESFSERRHHSKADSEHQWPASRLTQCEMTALRRISNRVGRPVNQLIRESVEVYVQLIETEACGTNVEEQTRPIALSSAIDMACYQAMSNKESDANETLEGIHTQLELLNQTLEDLQIDVQWALRNIVHHFTQQSSPPQRQLAADPDQQAMLLLRDLIGAPELKQSNVCDATRDTLEKILGKLSSSASTVEQKQPKVAEQNEDKDETEKPAIEKGPAGVTRKQDEGEAVDDGLLF